MQDNHIKKVSCLFYQQSYKKYVFLTPTELERYIGRFSSTRTEED